MYSDNLLYNDYCRELKVPKNILLLGKRKFYAAIHYCARDLARKYTHIYVWPPAHTPDDPFANAKQNLMC